MLKVRLPIAGALIAFLLAVLYLDYGSRWRAASHLVFLAVMAMAIHELYVLLERGPGWRPLKPLGIVASIALGTGEWMASLVAPGRSSAVWCVDGILLIFTLFILLAWFAPPEKHRDALGPVTGTLFGLLYVWLPGSYLPKVAMLQHPQYADRDVGIPCLLLTVMVAKLTDAGAYLVGRSVGRHKLAPGISPNKTVEGAAGGALAGVLVALALQSWLRIPFLDWIEVVLFGLIVSLVAQLGDLGESLIKRFCAAKDSGELLPGFGGILDVVDSLLLAAPAAYLLFHLFARTA